ncbi:MAG: GDP-mannose 4,6-dehydratase, partial [Acidibrevibacterium sp.]|uniref:GDP-mannose 4,6-dehydratase n=1 Tax=Acidibrevibacterium fodinaquatile TaxID=1969806 RepID=UPI0023A897EC
GAMAAESGLRVIRFRPFNHTGPGQSEAFVIPAFAAQIARIEAGAQAPVIRVGNLEPERDFLHVADVVRAYALALERFDELPAGAVFNLASGQPRRIGDILAAMIARASVPIRVEVDPARLRPVEIMRAVGDATKAREVLGWGASVDFRAVV